MGYTSRSSFIGNSAGYYGGGLDIIHGHLTLNASSIENNQVGDSGGGLRIESGGVFTLTNSILANNQANSVGGAFYIRGSNGKFIHNTTVNNQAGTPYDGIVVATGSTISLTNSLIASHTTGIATTGADISVTADHTLWWATGVYTDSAGGGALLTVSDLVGDPKFVSASNYHINFMSAAIDAGINTKLLTDIDRQPRPNGLGVDIGADELQLYRFTVTPGYKQTVQSSRTVTFTHTLKNMGFVTDTYLLKFSSSQEWGQLLTPASIVLAPSKIGTITTRVNVPPEVWYGTTDLSTITVKSKTDPNLSVTVTDITQANFGRTAVMTYLPLITKMK